MGNEQSVPVGERAQNRLSKPKTNASTSNLLSMISKPGTALGTAGRRSSQLLENG
jgi:hypothetical protein